MSSTHDTDDDSNSPRTVDTTQRLCKQREDREERKDQHSAHTACIRLHAFLLHEDLRQITSEQRNHCYDSVQREDQSNTLRVRSLDTKLILEISRRPEQEEPPNPVGHELTKRKRPSLFVFESLSETHLFLLLAFDFRLLTFDFVLMDILQLSLIHMSGLFRFVIDKDPDTCPDEAQRTDDDERPLPTEALRQQRNCSRSSQRTHRCTCVKQGGSERAVFLREILCGHLDSSREVTCLAKSQNQTAEQEKIHTHHGY